MLKFLLLEDNAIDAHLVQQMLRKSQLEHEIVWVKTRADFLAALASSSIDLILADYNLPEFNGIEALEWVKQHHPEIPFILVSGSLGEELAIDTLKQGATDYVLKQRLGRLVPAVNRALQEAEERQELKRTEAALSESEARYQVLISNMPGMAYRYAPGADGDAAFTYISSGSYELTELTPDIILQDANSFFALIHPDDLPSFHHSMATAVVDSAFWQWEGRIITPSGKLKWVQGRSRPAQTKYSEVWDGLLFDITDRKQAEEALRQSESRFRLIVESAKEYAIFTLDLNGIITSWNAGAERLLGYSEVEAIGSEGRIVFTPEDQEQGQPEWEMQTALTEERATNERWHMRKDGSRFWASGLMMRLGDEAGNAQGLVKIMQDKTAQRQANERLHLLYETTSDLLATEQPLRLMHNLFSKLSAQLELDYYYNYMVEEHNNHPMLHLRNYEGISDEEARSIEWIELGQYVCGIVAQERQQIVLNQAQLSSHPNAELLCSIGVTAYAGQPLIAQGQLLGTLSFASLTRTHFTPEEIDLLQSVCDQMSIALERTNLTRSIQQQAERLQEANRIKDEFLAVLSHELRSPLNPILGWAKLLQSGKIDAPRQAEALKTIERNAKLQTQLIEDLLDISRIMQGKLSLTVAPVDLPFVIEAAVETVRLAAEAKKIQILLDLGTAIMPISGDAARLQQVVWNLLTNAVKFTPNGGQVRVELRQCGQLAQIRVMDTGKGIDAQFLPHVFEYFRQADSTTTRKFGGLGLGLAIVRQIVEMHGGTVTAESGGEDQGAVFTVQFPILEQAVPTAPEPLQISRAIEEPLSNLHILVVDDDTDTREFQAFVLEQNGATVTAVASGLEALKVLDRSMPDVLLSDIGMPDMDGYELMQQIRSREVLQSDSRLSDQGRMISAGVSLLKAIALTAYASDFDQQKALQAGFQTHLTKPVEPEVLVKTIMTLLRSDR